MVHMGQCISRSEISLSVAAESSDTSPQARARRRGGGSFLLLRFSLPNAVKLTMKTPVHVRKNVL